jgi:lipoprotein-anchoring transpeptidase ErfK/SrfK
MSRSSISLVFTTGLLLTTMLAIVPTRLHAETTAPPSLDLHPQTKPTATSAPATVGATQKLATPSKLEAGSPSTGASIHTPSTPVTGNNSIPTAPAAKPIVTTASTSQPPIQDVVNLVLKLKDKHVYVYKADKFIAKYPVAIGKKGWETPTGEWYVMEKIKNPGWTSFKNGKVLSPGRENPLGERWIGFWTDGKDVIGFHGTPDVKSIGTAASHGCVRMHNKDVKALFPLVKVGTTVKVVDE